MKREAISLIFIGVFGVLCAILHGRVFSTANAAPIVEQPYQPMIDILGRTSKDKLVISPHTLDSGCVSLTEHSSLCESASGLVICDLLDCISLRNISKSLR